MAQAGIRAVFAAVVKSVVAVILPRRMNPPRHQRIIGWKAIASFLGCDVRTAQRWQATRGLPIQRVPGGAGASVWADPAELRGWLSTGAHERLEVEADGGLSEPVAHTDGLRPRIAVMPFANHLGEGDQAALVGGIVDDISVALTRFSALYVVSYLDSNAGVVPASVSYRLEGSVRAGGNQLRISARLVDNLTGHLLWAENLDGSAENIFTLHDQIAFKVASNIDSTIERTEMRRATQAPAQTTDGHELYWRANALFRRWDQAAIEEAIVLTDQLLEIEPDNAWALALGGFCRAAAASWSGDCADSLAVDAIARCCTAAAQAPHDAHVTGFAAGAFLMLGHDLKAAGDFAERTLTLHPGSALALFWNAWVDLFRGDLDRAGQRFLLSQELSPKSAAGGFSHAGLGLCRLLGDDPEGALPLLREAAQRAPHYVATQVALCVCLSEVGRDDEARLVLERLGGMPGADRFIATFELSAHRQRLAKGALQQQGQPEALKVVPGRVKASV